MAQLGCEPIYRDYVGVLLNNEMWRESLAGVPFEKRLLLLPKCLRVEDKCPAPFDEFGLLCKQCGLCTIQDLQAEAERLGYAVLVAEGSAIVMSLIQTGKIEAIVGVSCISVLERAFPYMEAAAIPGVAIPLLQDDCIDTNVDIDWVWDYIHLTGDDQTRRLDLSQLRDEVDFWFTPLNLDSIMGPAQGETEKIARQWLGRAGKRWRPFLTVAAYQALARRARIADARRPAQSRRRGRMLSQGLAHPRRHRGRRCAALRGENLARGARHGGRAECRRSPHWRRLSAAGRVPGQRGTKGRHDARRRGRPARAVPRARAPNSSGRAIPRRSVRWKCSIFSGRKPRPRFGSRFSLGPFTRASMRSMRKCFPPTARRSASPIKSATTSATSARAARRTTSPACGPACCSPSPTSAAQGDQKIALEAHWRRLSTASPAEIEALYLELHADERCRTLLESYKEESIRTLRDVENPNLKGLLRRVIGKIFNDTEIKGWCKEFENRNASSRPRFRIGAALCGGASTSEGRVVDTQDACATSIAGTPFSNMNRPRTTRRAAATFLFVALVLCLAVEVAFQSAPCWSADAKPAFPPAFNARYLGLFEKPERGEKEILGLSDGEGNRRDREVTGLNGEGITALDTASGTAIEKCVNIWIDKFDETFRAEYAKAPAAILVAFDQISAQLEVIAHLAMGIEHERPNRR